MNENRAPAPLLKEVYGSAVVTPWDVAVVIPAKNEARRIQPCLMAIADAIDQTPATVGVILCVNDTQDDTARKADCILRMRGVSCLVLDMDFPAGSGGVGRARDLGCKLALLIDGPPTLLMTTDADSCVDPDWINANIDELTRADVVFGAIVPDPDELQQLQPALARHGAIEAEYKDASVRLVNYLDPVPYDPDPTHRTAAGASIALTVAALDVLGGLPWSKVREDRDLFTRAEAHDLRIRHATTPKVMTSCRLTGRAEGGMATTLSLRCEEDDPWCDEWLEPADTLVARFRAKGRLRSVWPDPALCRATIRRLLGAGPMPNPQSCGAFGEFWQRLEANHPALVRRRLRHSDAARELPALLDYQALFARDVSVLRRQDPQGRSEKQSVAYAP